MGTVTATVWELFELGHTPDKVCTPALGIVWADLVFIRL